MNIEKINNTFASKDSSEIRLFLNFFPNHVIQFFDDNKARSDKRLARTVNCFKFEEVIAKQKEGCGAYFSANGFRGGRRVKDNLTSINAVFIDFDVAKQEDDYSANEVNDLKNDALNILNTSPLAPHFITETKHGYHAIWLTKDLSDIKTFELIEKGLIAFYGADKGSKDVSRVLRLPGFYHLKDIKQPFKCKLVQDNSNKHKYNPQEIINAYKIEDTLAQEPEPYAIDYKNLTASSVEHTIIDEAIELSIKDVIEKCGELVNITITFVQNSDKSLQIIENGEITSGFISSRDNIAYSPSGKNRKGNSITIGEYYLNEVGGNAYNRYEIAEILLNKNTHEKEVENAKKEKLPITSFQDLLKRDIKTPEYLIEGLLPEVGVSIIQGHPGSYKTWITMYYAYCISSGIKVFDKYEVKQSNILLINVDDYMGNIRDRLLKVGFNDANAKERLFVWDGGLTFTGDKKDKLPDSLIKFIRENNIKLVIFDTFRNIHNKDENKSDEITPIMRVLKGIAENCAVVLIHHLNKEGKASDPLSSRGSTAILGDLISSMNIEWIIKEKAIKITQGKNKIGERLEPFLVSFNKDINEKLTFIIKEPTIKTSDDEVLELANDFIEINCNFKGTKDDFFTQLKAFASSDPKLGEITRAAIERTHNKLVATEKLVLDKDNKQFNKKVYYVDLELKSEDVELVSSQKELL